MDHQALAELFGNWGEFFGSVGVLLTLVYLSLQVGQAKKATRAQIVQSATEQLNEINRMIASDPTWATIISKSELSIDSLSADERNRYSFLELSLLNGCDDLYLHYTDGYVDPRIWEKWRNTLKAIVASPGWQQWWRQQPFGFSQQFIGLVNGLIEESIESGGTSNWEGLTGPRSNT